MIIPRHEVTEKVSELIQLPLGLEVRQLPCNDVTESVSEHIPTNPPSEVEKYFWCKKRDMNRVFATCVRCKHYPCDYCTPGRIRDLANTDYVVITNVTFISKRRKFVLAKMQDGTYKELDIDVKSPNPDQLKGVEEVYVISKVLIPVLTLRAKNESDNIEAVRDPEPAEIKSGRRKEKETQS
ncbi:MAG: hypothetical protein V1844_10455 [Pseudomonadota bacterium]